MPSSDAARSLWQAFHRVFTPPVIPTTGDRRNDRLVLLDALRGVAAFAVLFWHYQHFFYRYGINIPEANFREKQPFYQLLKTLYDFGDHAVPLFWIISGFVFALVYIDIKSSARSFFVSRIARLYPLHILTLCIVAALQQMALSKYGFSLIYDNNDTYHFMLQIAFASNWGFAEGFSFNAPIWSVSVEILVYAAFWFVFRNSTYLGIIGPILLIFSLLILQRIDSDNQIIRCATLFFSGSALYMLFVAFDRNRVLQFVVGIMAILGGLIVYQLPYPTISGSIGFAGVFGGIIFLLAWLEPFCPKAMRRYFKFIGDNTYGMYLWHIPVQLCMIMLVGNLADVSFMAMRPWFLVLFLSAVVAIARVSFVYFERPSGRRLRQLFDERHGRVSAYSAP